MTVQSGRPYTIYSGANTLSNVVQTPADCSGVRRRRRAAFTTRTGSSGIFTPEERAAFAHSGGGRRSATAAATASSGPAQFNLDLALVKRTRVAGSQTFEFRRRCDQPDQHADVRVPDGGRDEQHVRPDPEHGHQRLAQGADRVEVQLLTLTVVDVRSPVWLVAFGDVFVEGLRFLRRRTALGCALTCWQSLRRTWRTS